MKNHPKYAPGPIKVSYDTYANGGTAILLLDDRTGERLLTATSWIPGLGEGEVAVKDYSENEGTLLFLVSNEIVSTPHKILDGFPICYVTKE
jgi:hypothetical protein